MTEKRGRTTTIDELPEGLELPQIGPMPAPETGDAELDETLIGLTSAQPAIAFTKLAASTYTATTIALRERLRQATDGVGSVRWDASKLTSLPRKIQTKLNQRYLDVFGPQNERAGLVMSLGALLLLRRDLPGERALLDLAQRHANLAIRIAGAQTLVAKTAPFNVKIQPQSASNDTLEQIASLLDEPSLGLDEVPILDAAAIAAFRVDPSTAADRLIPKLVPGEVSQRAYAILRAASRELGRGADPRWVKATCDHMISLRDPSSAFQHLALLGVLRDPSSIDAISTLVDRFATSGFMPDSMARTLEAIGDPRGANAMITVLENLSHDGYFSQVVEMLRRLATHHDLDRLERLATRLGVSPAKKTDRDRRHLVASLEPLIDELRRGPR